MLIGTSGVLIRTRVNEIRDREAEKVFSELGRLRVLKQAREAQGHRMVIAVAGCVAQAEGAEILARAPYVDIVLGPQTYHRLPEMVARASRAAGAVIDTDFPAEQKFDFLPDAAAPLPDAAPTQMQRLPCTTLWHPCPSRRPARRLERYCHYR